MTIKKCLKCGATVKILNDCNCKDCGITCCGTNMISLKVNESDGAVEKHKPECKVVDDEIIVTVNHVMEDEHFIEWICLKSDNKEEYVYLKPKDKAVVRFKKKENAIVYSYCNKHGLWETKL